MYVFLLVKNKKSEFNILMLFKKTNKVNEMN